MVCCLSFHTVKSVNSSEPQLLQDMRVVTVLFDETLFDIQTVRVMLSSNCTSSVIVDYNNPVMISIPDTGTNTGQCRYVIQVIDGNAQQIGYPLTGFFVAEGMRVKLKITALCYVYHQEFMSTVDNYI